jgi:hypothetical protein
VERAAVTRIVRGFDQVREVAAKPGRNPHRKGVKRKLRPRKALQQRHGAGPQKMVGRGASPAPAAEVLPNLNVRFGVRHGRYWAW